MGAAFDLCEHQSFPVRGFGLRRVGAHELQPEPTSTVKDDEMARS